MIYLAIGLLGAFLGWAALQERRAKKRDPYWHLNQPR